MDPHRVSVNLVGSNCKGHLLCVRIDRGVPPPLRCNPGAPSPVAQGGGARCGCELPRNHEELIRRQLRDNLEECKRRGFVLIEAA